MIFNDLYKKRGFHESLYVLYGAKNYSLVLPIFFERLEEMGSYYNAFFRVKDEMQEYNIIEYKKNRNKENVIALTDKGVKITRLLREIDDLMDLSFDEYKDKMKIKKKREAARRRKRLSKKQSQKT